MNDYNPLFVDALKELVTLGRSFGLDRISFLQDYSVSSKDSFSILIHEKYTYIQYRNTFLELKDRVSYIGIHLDYPSYSHFYRDILNVSENFVTDHIAIKLFEKYYHSQTNYFSFFYESRIPLVKKEFDKNAVAIGFGSIESKSSHETIKKAESSTLEIVKHIL